MGEGRGPGNMQALSLIKARRCRPQMRCGSTWLSLGFSSLQPGLLLLSPPDSLPRGLTTAPGAYGSTHHDLTLCAQTPDPCLCLQASTIALAREAPGHTALPGLGTTVLSWATLFYDISQSRNLQECVVLDTGLFFCAA